MRGGHGVGRFILSIQYIFAGKRHHYDLLQCFYEPPKFIRVVLGSTVKSTRKVRWHSRSIGAHHPSCGSKSGCWMANGVLLCPRNIPKLRSCMGLVVVWIWASLIIVLLFFGSMGVACRVWASNQSTNFASCPATCCYKKPELLGWDPPRPPRVSITLEVLQHCGNRNLWSEWRDATHGWGTPRGSTKALRCTDGAPTSAFPQATPLWSSRGQIVFPKPQQHWNQSTTAVHSPSIESCTWYSWTCKAWNKQAGSSSFCWPKRWVFFHSHPFSRSPPLDDPDKSVLNGITKSAKTLCADCSEAAQLTTCTFETLTEPPHELNAFVSAVWSQGTAPLLVFPRPNAQTLGTSVREPRQFFLMLSRNLSIIVGEKDDSQKCLGYEIESWKHDVSNVLASDSAIPAGHPSSMQNLFPQENGLAREGHRILNAVIPEGFTTNAMPL